MRLGQRRQVQRRPREQRSSAVSRHRNPRLPCVSIQLIRLRWDTYSAHDQSTHRRRHHRYQRLRA